MKPLKIIYWTRAGLGVIIGILCAVYVIFSVTSDLANIYTLLTGLSFAMLFYMSTYYIVKLKFFSRVEKQSKLMTQGIGIYFFAWLVSWTLITTLLMPSVAVNIYVSDTGRLAEGQKFWVAARNDAGQVVQNVTTASGALTITLLPPDTYTFELGIIELGTFELGERNQTQPLRIGWLQSLNVVFNVTQPSG